MTQRRPPWRTATVHPEADGGDSHDNAKRRVMNPPFCVLSDVVNRGQPARNASPADADGAIGSYQHPFWLPFIIQVVIPAQGNRVNKTCAFFALPIKGR